MTDKTEEPLPTKVKWSEREKVVQVLDGYPELKNHLSSPGVVGLNSRPPFAYELVMSDLPAGKTPSFYRQGKPSAVPRAMQDKVVEMVLSAVTCVGADTAPGWTLLWPTDKGEKEFVAGLPIVVGAMN